MIRLTFGNISGRSGLAFLVFCPLPPKEARFGIANLWWLDQCHCTPRKKCWLSRSGTSLLELPIMPINVSERNERPHQHVNPAFYWAAGKLTISAALESARNRKQDADQNLVTEALCQCTEWLNNVSVATTGTPLRISKAKPSTASQNNCVACTGHTRNAGLPPENGGKSAQCLQPGKASVVTCVTKCAQRAQPAKAKPAKDQ